MPRAEKWSDDQYVQWVFYTDPMVALWQKPVDMEKLVPALRELREASFGQPTAREMLAAWKKVSLRIGGVMMAKLIRDESLGELVNAFPKKKKDAPGERTLFSDGSMRVMLVASPDGSRADVVMREV